MNPPCVADAPVLECSLSLLHNSPHPLAALLSPRPPGTNCRVRRGADKLPPCVAVLCPPGQQAGHRSLCPFCPKAITSSSLICAEKKLQPPWDGASASHLPSQRARSTTEEQCAAKSVLHQRTMELRAAGTAKAGSAFTTVSLKTDE